MQSLGRIILCTSLALTVLPGLRCHAEGLAGVWTNYCSALAPTNKVERFETVEFFKNGSLKITSITVVDGKRWTNAPYTGTYSVLATNRVSLKITPQDIPPGSQAPPLSVSCSIVGDELRIPLFITSVVPEYRKYRRVK
jgi:hypothetical protein